LCGWYVGECDFGLCVVCFGKVGGKLRIVLLMSAAWAFYILVQTRSLAGHVLTVLGFSAGYYWSEFSLFVQTGWSGVADVA
jgi:hypothetical protein